MENYKKNVIPETDSLKEKGEELFSKIRTLKMHKFTDFYELKDGEYRRNKSVKGEISGLYIFYEGNEPIYVGISRKVISRIKQHMYGKRYNEASLAYLIARESSGFKGERKDFKDDVLWEQIKRRMRERWGIKIIPVADPYERYFSEIYLATKLKTHWNDFETH